MKNKHTIILIMLFVLSIFSGHALFAQQPPLSYSWQLKEIVVGDSSYTDSISTDLKFTFNTNGTCEVVSGDSSGTVAWRFTDTSYTQVVINEGTSEQQYLNLVYLDENFLFYNVDYNVNGTVYTYLFKFVRILS